MYIPKHFKVSDQDELFMFVAKNSFGQLVSTVEGRFYASHIPFLLNEERTCLLGHVARENPQWNGIYNCEVLLTFQGEHSYVSPSCYSTPSIPPTWNYQVVHVYGRAAVFTDQDRLSSLVNRLTEKNESGNSKPWKPDYPQQMLKAIVGLEIKITSIEGKFKLSQNRSLQDQQQLADKMKSAGFVSLANAMKSNLPR